MTVARLLWSDAGSPAPTKRTEATTAPCYLCGEPCGQGVARRDALGT